MRGNAHVRFGGRAGETDAPKGAHRAPARPLHLRLAPQRRRLLIRTDRRDDIHEAFLAIACSLICLKLLQADDSFC